MGERILCFLLLSVFVSNDQMYVKKNAIETSRCYLKARGFRKYLLFVPVASVMILVTRGSFRIQGKEKLGMSLLESLRPLKGIREKTSAL